MSRSPQILDEDVRKYILGHMTALDPHLAAIAASNAALPNGVAAMQIAIEQAQFLELLVRSLRPRSAIEIGTFTGMSSLAIARGLEEGGTLLCCDISEEWTSKAREFWQKAGVDDRIELRLGDALETVRDLPNDPQFDLAFLDADKENYPNYLAELIPRLRSGGILLVDNAFWNGRVLDPEDRDPTTVGVRTLNDSIKEDDRVAGVILPIGDGTFFIRKK